LTLRNTMNSSTEYASPSQGPAPTKIRDIEEKLRLVKDRLLLIGQTHIEEREKSFAEIQDLKTTVLTLKKENMRISEVLKRVTEQLASTARSEDLAILQRQLDLFRK
jgi:hypothetical protein